MFFDENCREVAERLNTDAKSGLTTVGVDASKRKHGLNALTVKKEKGIFSRILSALLEPMMLILVFAWTVTFGVNLGRYLKCGEGSFYECIGILIAISISVALTVIMEGRSKKAFDMLKKMGGDVKAKTVRNGETTYVSASQVVVGDVVLVEAGDKIVADGRLIESNSLETDESMLTGESKALKKDCRAVLTESTPLAERVNMVYSGTFVCGGSGKYIVTAVGDKAEVGKIASDLSEKSTISAPLEEKLARLGKVVSVMGAISAVLVFALSIFRLIILGEVSFDSVENAFIEAIVLIVAAVPEGLPSTVAISLTLNVIKLAKSNALIKKLVATETVGAVSVICSDKTGTLTQNKITLERFVANGRFSDAKHFNDRLVALNSAVNSTAELTSDGYRGSKTECALLAALKSSGISYSKLRKSADIVDRTPFSSVIKYMRTVAVIDGKTYDFVKGAPEVVLEKTRLSLKRKSEILYNVSEYQKQSKRVLAFAHGENGVFVFDGFAVLDDKLRDNVYSSVQSCRSSGIKVKILTGDNIVTATAIANELGVGEGYGRIVSGDEIESMSDEQLKKSVDGISVVARSTPNVKLRVVKALQETGEVVAVTGDGVNDAPAIERADIGIAMGDGSEITKEASDIVLMDNSFSTIVKAISFGRNIYSNFQRFISFQLTVNLSSMCIIIAFLILGLKSPFSSTCLLWLNVIMDGPLALSLGLEPPRDSALMQRPVKRTDNILSVKMFARVAIHAVFMALVVAVQEMYNFLGVSAREKYTVTFATFVIFHLFNAINCREVRKESALKGIFGNKLLVFMSVLTFLLQIIITQFIPNFFGTVALSPLTWLKIVVLCSGVVVLSESYKAVYRYIVKRREIGKTKRRDGRWTKMAQGADT